MIAVDTLLQQRHRGNNPIKVALVGAGASARMIALHLLIPVQGVRLVAVADRSLVNALQTFREGGVSAANEAATQGVLEDTINRGGCAITDNATLFCESAMVDIIIDATGAVEFGAQLAMRAIENHKHLVLVNTELDSTLGPILKVHADKAGVTVTNTDGDEPGWP